MSDRLLVAIVGNRNSGKSKTWRHLFGHSVHAGVKRLPLYYGDYATVYVIPSSPQESKITVESTLGRERPRIVLCAIQYSFEAHETISFFVDNGYSILFHWLNPGYKDKITPAFDRHGLIARVLAEHSLVGIRSGRTSPRRRCNDLKDFIYGWAMKRSLVQR